MILLNPPCSQVRRISSYENRSVHNSAKYRMRANFSLLAYGHTVKSEDDAYVRLAEEAATATVEAGSPASTLVDFFPPSG